MSHVKSVGLSSDRVPFGVLPDPLQVDQGVAGSEGVGTEILVAREADVDKGKAVVLQRFLDNFDRLLPLHRRGLGHKSRPAAWTTSHGSKEGSIIP